MRNPIIGITANLDRDNNIILRRQYCESIEHYGGIPIILPPIGDPTDAARRLDGILLSGGGDIVPELFGISEYDQALIGEPMPDRDRYELAIARFSYEKSIPTLGICRGIQVMNVALGGTLLLDIPHHSQSLARNQPSHMVRIASPSKLSRILSIEVLPANSFHHQAVDRIPSMLTASAVSEDGIIEAVESRDDRFYIGVQWHPEHMPDTVASLPIAALVNAARQS